LQHHSNLKHTPYDGSEPLFKIGLRPFDEYAWLDFDDTFEFFLTEKKRLMTKIPEQVFQAEEDTQNAQLEVFDLICDFIEKHGLPIREVDRSLSPLLQAAMLVQEDLVIMRKSEQGWRLVAGSVCFPSSWALQEKIGKPLHDVHAPVPNFNEGSRNASMIERIFDNLQIGMPVERFNWSVYNDDALYHDDRSSEHMNQRTDCFLRVERQTLTKLPKSGDILFTIRIYVDPFDALKQRNDKAEIAQGFIRLLNMMNGAELAYKGLDEGRDILISRLQKLVDAT
jgi:hypothetical protein